MGWAIAALVATIVTLVLALQVAGSPAASPEGIPDPGTLTRWGLPIAQAARDIAAVVTIGLILTATLLLPSAGAELQGLALQALQVVRRTATAWALATVALYVVTVSDTFTVPLPQSLAWSYLSGLAFETPLGRSLIAQGAIATAVALWSRWALNVKATCMLLGLAVGGLLPPALTGHSASSGGHDLAVVSLGLHLIGSALWVGGLAGLGWIALRGSKRLPAGVRRYSVLAAWCLGVVALSGAVNAALRLGTVSALFTTSYGVLVLGKVAAVAALGAFGWAHRRRTIPILSRSLAATPDGRDAVAAGRAFLRLAAVELIVMAMTVGLAVALSRSATPVPDEVYQDPVEQLIGISLPPAPTPMHLLLGWAPNGVGLAIVVGGAALYGRGLWALRRRGDAWPVGRTVSWLLGLLVIAWATFGGIGLYSHVLFSAHMVAHMLLTMVAPIFLVLGAPVTLALRTLPGPRQPGELAPRQLLVALLHSRFTRLVTHPLFAAAVFVGSLYALYFTSLFPALMDSHLGHAAMEIHFLASGSLYYYVLVGVDPSPRRLVPLVRFVVLLVTVPFHAFFAIAVMAETTVLGGTYWAQLERPYRSDLLADQNLGGGIAWAMGELPLLLVMGALFVQWFRSDRSEARRFDRHEDDREDAALAEYNAYLATLRAQEKQIPR